MSKNKKGKVISLKQPALSPEKYIKTQARALPLYECLISEEWEDSGIANIIITRKHITGNVTVGIYCVDLYCLGLKDTGYKFNVPFDDYSYQKISVLGLKKCSYALAHNIIYGGIAYAEDYGFKAHRDFAVSQFILEEDDEQVELIDVEFGCEGIPTFMPGPNDDAAKIKQVTATLNRTAGPGNFEIFEDDGEDDFEDDDFDDEYGDDDEDFDDEDLVNDFAARLEEEFVKFPRLLKKVDKVYKAVMKEKHPEITPKKSTIGKGYKVSNEYANPKYSAFDNEEQEQEYERLDNMFAGVEDFEAIIEDIKKAISRFPDKSRFYDLLMSAFSFSGREDERKELIEEMFALFPDHLMARISFSSLLLSDGKVSEAFELFGGCTDLDQLYPERTTFYISEVANFCAAMCLIYTDLHDIASADLYMDTLFKKKLTGLEGGFLVSMAVKGLCAAKMKVISDETGFGL